MKVILLSLSGDRSRALETLTEYYPGAAIEIISRAEFETGNVTKRLTRLRSLRPHVFAISTERLSWQRGQNLFMLFGALAGAREVLMLDSYGGVNKKSRSSLLFGAPARLSNEAIKSATTMRLARRELAHLERAVSSNQPQRRQVKAHPRIAYLRATPGPGTQAGGAASHIKGVVDGLLDFGARVKVISNDKLAGLDDQRIEISVVEPEPFGGTRALFDIHNNLLFTRHAIQLIEEFEPDVIYQRYARFSWVGVAASLRQQVPLFLEYNGSEVWLGRNWDHVGRLDLLARYELLNLRAAARIFVVSDVERKNLERSGVPAEKIVVNPNGVDPERFRPGISGPEVRRELGLTEQDIVAGFVGTFGPWHGVVALAEAIRAIPDEVPVKFLLVGTGSLHAKVESMLTREVATGRVLFTGPVEHLRVPFLLDACDILVSPHVPLEDGSDFFGSPTKLFEYMAMEKGIVASRLGQIGEVLVDGTSAILVEPGNVPELAAAITRLTQQPELRKQLGHNARAAAISAHTWKHNANQVLKSYAAWNQQ